LACFSARHPSVLVSAPRKPEQTLESQPRPFAPAPPLDLLADGRSARLADSVRSRLHRFRFCASGVAHTSDRCVPGAGNVEKLAPGRRRPGRTSAPAPRMARCANARVFPPVPTRNQSTQSRSGPGVHFAKGPIKIRHAPAPCASWPANGPPRPMSRTTPQKMFCAIQIL